MDAFSDKLSYIFNNEMEKAREISAKYYETISKEELDSHYVAVEDDVVLGAMQLKHKYGIKKSGIISISDMIQKLDIFRGLSATAVHGYEFEPCNEDEIIDMLYEIQEDRGSLNQEIIDRFILYISKSIKQAT